MISDWLTGHRVGLLANRRSFAKRLPRQKDVVDNHLLRHDVISSRRHIALSRRSVVPLSRCFCFFALYRCRVSLSQVASFSRAPRSRWRFNNAIKYLSLPRVNAHRQWRIRKISKWGWYYQGSDNASAKSSFSLSSGPVHIATSFYYKILNTFFILLNFKIWKL